MRARPAAGGEYTLLLLFKLYHMFMLPGNPAAAPFDALAAPALAERGGDPMDPQGQPKFVQITTTVAPLSPTLLYALDSAGSVWLFNFAKKKWGRLANDREA
jgi:hypothetical protein